MEKIWDLCKYENNVAIVDEYGTTLTYRELYKLGNELYTAVGKRCHIFILCDNVIGAMVGYVSFVNLGIVPFMFSTGVDHNMLENLISIYTPMYIWLPSSMVGDFDGYEKIYSNVGYTLLKNPAGKQITMYDELALLLTTSGSTGSPKFVRQSYKNIKANTESIVEYLKLDSTERAITTLPMNYTYGLSIINTHLYVGGSVLLTNKHIMYKEFWDFFKMQEATSFGGVPYTYEMLDKLRFYKMNIPSLRTMTQAGGKLTPELHEKFAKYAQETGRNFVVMYGQCEATARMGYLPADRAVEKKGSIGVVIPGGKFKLIDINGNEIKKPHIMGELVYEGDNVTLGYAEKMDDLAKYDERGGILVTGDMAQFDEDGYYYIVGRKKRFLKIHGNRVNLDEMDQMIKGNFQVEVACGGVDDHMYIFLTEGSLANDIKKFASDKTGLNLGAFTVKVLDEIPKNDAGKIQYKELEKYYSKTVQNRLS